MTDQPFDLTPFVNEFDMNMTSGLKPVLDSDGETVTYQAFYETDINLDFNIDHETIFKGLADSRAVMKLHQRGKYWFDRAYEIDVTMKSFTASPDGAISADYEGTNIKDLTDYTPLARFLRWILCR